MASVVTVNVNDTNYEEATNQILLRARRNESSYICIANVHVLMEAWDSPRFAEIVNNADLVTPDGMPLVWMMRAKGLRQQSRVYGPTLMLHVLEAAAQEDLPVGFYGGKHEVLKSLVKRMMTRYRKLNITFSYSPPFREINPEEDKLIIERINQSAAKILFVGLGCPKQEIWMATHRDRVKAVMIGVGAAFDFHAGVKPQAPDWMQRLGLEWSFRLFTEPRRLWRRYFYHNPRFLVLALADLLGLLRRMD